MILVFSIKCNDGVTTDTHIFYDAKEVSIYFYFTRTFY